MSEIFVPKWQLFSWLSFLGLNFSVFPNFSRQPSPLPQHFALAQPRNRQQQQQQELQHRVDMAVNTPTVKNSKKKMLLSDLPDELLAQILKSLPSQHDLHALCLVNRRLHHVADPVLYKSIAFEQPHHHIAFSESLSHRPRRGSLIQNVRLEYPGSELAEIISLRDGSYRIDNFSDTISRMSNLENLDVSVPESLLHGIGTLFNGPFDLACLKTCEYYVRVDWLS